jgi:hypothetical protein
MKTKLDFGKLDSDNPKIKYGFTKELLKIASETPEILYDYYDYWTEMMNSGNSIFKWTAIDIIGYLSAVDTEDKTDTQIKNLLTHLHGGNLITSNHAIFSLGLIAKNKPHHKQRILKELLAISKDTFETDECKNIATGKVILTLGNFQDDINNKEALSFIKQARNNSRNATRKKADILMKKIVKSNL